MHNNIKSDINSSSSALRPFRAQVADKSFPLYSELNREQKVRGNTLLKKMKGTLFNLRIVSSQ